MEEEFIITDPPELNISEIEKITGMKIKDPQFYRKAFTHKSALKRYTLTESFETLEFMGDSVLGFIITKFLFDRYEEMQEGFLTKARTKLVRGETLSGIARKLGLDRLVLMDDKGIRNGWNNNDKILEDVFEALVGAIYMDLGLLNAKKFVLNLFENPIYVDMECIMIDDNYKDQLMRLCQTNRWGLPEYNNEQVDSVFHVNVIVTNTFLASGTGKNKKQAEQDAAKNMLAILKGLGYVI